MEQGELADAMGISRNTVSAAEKGKNMPRKIVINAWALATGFDAEWLRNGSTPVTDNGPGDDGCAIRDSNPEPAD